MWWQLDMVYILIRTLEFLGLASDVRLPEPKTMEARLRKKKPAVVAEPAAEDEEVEVGVIDVVVGRGPLGR